MKHQELREEVARISRQMMASGLVVGTAGNVLVTPSGLDYSELGPEDVALVDLEGRFLDGPFAPSSETPMHVGIYRSRPRVGGIVHTHARFDTTLACLHGEIPPVHYVLAALSDEGKVPLADYATYGTEVLALNASEALGEAYLPARESQEHYRGEECGRGVLQDGGVGGDDGTLLPRPAGWRARHPDEGADLRGVG